VNEWNINGDLNYIAGWKLLISDCIKDLIIVGGKIIYLQNIEDVV